MMQLLGDGCRCCECVEEETRGIECVFVCWRIEDTLHTHMKLCRIYGWLDYDNRVLWHWWISDYHCFRRWIDEWLCKCETSWSTLTTRLNQRYELCIIFYEEHMQQNDKILWSLYIKYTNLDYGLKNCGLTTNQNILLRISSLGTRWSCTFMFYLLWQLVWPLPQSNWLVWRCQAK